MLKSNLNMGVEFVRPTIKDRAKTILKDFLSVRAGFIELADRINRTGLCVCLIQRKVRLQ